MKFALIPLILASTVAAAEPEVHYQKCQSGFSYLGAQYQGTTDKNNSGSQWCYLEQTIDGATWGHVRSETIPEFKTVSGKTCQAPSTY